MSIFKWIGRHIGKSSAHNVPEVSWHTSEKECAFEAIRDVKKNEPRRVLVIGSVGALAHSVTENALTEHLPHRLLINHEASLAWLGETVRMARRTSDPILILSPYPRRSLPPTIHVMESTSLHQPIRRTIVLENTSLALRTTDEDVSVGIYLIGLYTSGYWKSIQESQSELVRPINRFRMMASRDFGAFIDSESNEIESTAPDQRQEKLLQLSEAWESDPKSSILAYEGTVIT